MISVTKSALVSLLIALYPLAVFSGQPTSTELEEKGRIYNNEAPIPPQCYTRTENRFNPCYTCHQTYRNYLDEGRTNFMHDGGLQGLYEFSDEGVSNHWRNLFIDRSAQVAEIIDADIDSYIAQDNYSDVVDPSRAENIRHWAPDLKNFQLGPGAFDARGHALDGSGWVAFNYKPLPSTFWPTNGSTDDVIIRLSPPFREDTTGELNNDVYQANLALVEMSIHGLETISTPDIDELKVGQDLNDDGNQGFVKSVNWRPNYLGKAGGVPVVKSLYPKGTEFIHSVRYVDLDENGVARISPRMKELRWMKKIAFKSPANLKDLYINERQEKNEGRLPKASVAGKALDKSFGWVLSAYIEDSNGQLRYQTFEETFFCTGCHSSIGSTIDQTFAFGRKPSGERGWGYIDLNKLGDAPNRGEQEGEYLTYLQRVGGGSEFRNNDEMQRRWFKSDGSVDVDKVRAASLAELISPSQERARTLNKAYRVIVKEQSFHLGRDATLKPPKNVFEQVDNHTEPLERRFQVQNWDIRLDWNE